MPFVEKLMGHVTKMGVRSRRAGLRMTVDAANHLSAGRRLLSTSDAESSMFLGDWSDSTSSPYSSSSRSEYPAHNARPRLMLRKALVEDGPRGKAIRGCWAKCEELQ